MITVNHQSITRPSVISEQARRAIAQGVDRGDPLANLEYLGVTVRTINILENSKFGITTLEQLVSQRREQLLEIPNVTPATVDELLRALARYHELEEARRVMEARIVRKSD
jgi:DNA-directed RNA polymerase alpha subunit